MNEQERLKVEFLRFLHTLAADRECFVSDLSTTITSAAMDFALEAYRMGTVDGRLQVSNQPARSHQPTVRAPYTDKLDAMAHERPTVPPPATVRRRPRTHRPLPR